MGGSKEYEANGGFKNTKFKVKYITLNGIKIIETKDNAKRPQTPMFSNTPGTMYAKVDNKSGLVNQVSIYGRGADKRAKLKDIDIGHKHSNPDNKLKFYEADIHIHDYDENCRRSSFARKPSKKEYRLIMVARYGKRKNV